MKKFARIENLDCANCAAKLESKIAKIDGVNEASINFMAQKLMLDVEDAKYQSVAEEVLKVAKKFEPDCKIIGL